MVRKSYGNYFDGYCNCSMTQKYWEWSFLHHKINWNKQNKTILWWCDICWYLYYINVFSYICKKNKIGRPGHRCTTTVRHYKAVLSGIIPLSEHCSFSDLNIALCHIAISIKFQLTVKPFLREWFVNPCLQL